MTSFGSALQYSRDVANAGDKAKLIAQHNLLRRQLCVRQPLQQGLLCTGRCCWTITEAFLQIQVHCHIKCCLIENLQRSCMPQLWHHTVCTSGDDATSRKASESGSGF
jgi:hypothetical protein